MAVSFAFNGASFGGIVVVPVLMLLVDRLGFSSGVGLVCLAMGLTLVPVVLRWFHRSPATIGLAPDGGPPIGQAVPAARPAPGALPRRFLASWHFASVSVPFALGLMAQVGFITHQVAFLKPALGAIGAGWAVSLTTACAVLGRLGVGLFVDRVNRRVVAAGNFLLQVGALALLLSARGPLLLYAGCALFGLSVGNMTSLPSLIVQVEFPRQVFARVVGAVIAANQFMYALGPGLLGWLRDLSGSYRSGLVACMALLLVACVVVLGGAACAAPQRAAVPR